jgi:hypothetical protein
MEQEKKKRKSVPRPGSGRRGSDGAVGLKMMSLRVRPDQVDKFKRLGGSVWLRSAIDAAKDPE